MIESEASVKGRVLAELLSHVTNDLQIGKKIKSGELRRRLKEPPWIPPACFKYFDGAVFHEAFVSERKSKH